MSEPERQTVTREHEGPESPAPTPIGLPPRWRPIRFLGQGGQGQVWLVEDSALREQVALKVLAPSTSPTNHERLRREVRVGRNLQHPGLIRIHELHEDGERLMVAMEYLPGGTLAARLKGGPLPVDEVVEVARQVLEALAYLHDQRVVHRDVKPSNLILDADGRLKLADFGLARPLDESATLTVTGAALGTLAYMSPEQLLGQEAGPPADLYSLGVTLHELLTGERPARVGSPSSGVGSLLPGPQGSLRPQRPDCPAWLDRFVRRLLEPRPADRYPSAGAALEALLARRGRRSPRVWRWRLTAAAIVVAACAAAIGLFVTGPEVVSVTHRRRTVVALDGRGRTLWRHEAPGEVYSTLVVDLMGDRSPEVAVASLDPPREDGREGRMEVLDRQCRVVMQDRVVGLDGPDLADEVGGIRLKAVELRPGRPALAWIALHTTAYPSLLWLWDGRSQQAPACLLRSSGHLHSVQAVDLFGDDRRELVVTGINNPMGFQNLVAIVELIPSVTSEAYRGFTSPDQGVAWLVHGEGRTHHGMFTPLGEADGNAEIRAAGRDGIVLATRSGEVRLDPHGNPQGSPLYGQGSAARSAAWDDLAALCDATERETVEPVPSWRELEGAHPAALSEPAMRLATTLLFARSLARAGRHREVVDLLDEARAADPRSGDLRLRLAEQLIILGEGERGSALLLDGRRLPGRGRTPSDEPWTVAFSATHRGDEPDLRSVLDWLRPQELVGGESVVGVQALWAFCRGRWGDPSLDARPPVVGLPMPDLLRLWTSLERGDSPPDGIAARAASLAKRPEHRPLAQLLGAAAALRRNEPERALGLAEQAAQELERRGRTEVEAFVWRGLAERVLADCHAAAGDADAAARHQDRARSLAPRCWFGQGEAGPMARAAAGRSR